MMALVLAATGLFLYLRLEAQLDQSIDRELRSRARTLTAEIRVADVGRARDVMGFRPAYTTREALSDFASALRLRDAKLLHETAAITRP